MPTAPGILGFSNRWYRAALEHAAAVRVAGRDIKLITAPYFLATEMEAFYGRGRGDYMMSHDLQDLAAVIDGRPDEANQGRLPLLLERMRLIAGE